MKRKQYVSLTLIAVFMPCFSWASQQDVLTSRGETFTLSPKICAIAKSFYSSLNFSPLFLVDNLLRAKRMRALLHHPRIAGGTPVTVTTRDGEQIECTFFDRKSDKLLVIGTGFGNEKEKVAPLIHIFDKMNIVIFSYRGHGINQKKVIDTTQWGVEPPQQIKGYLKELKPLINWNRIPNINLAKTTFGEMEEADLLAVVNHFTAQREYQKKFAIFFCFSSYVGAKVIAQYPGLFDKIIFDSSLHAPREIVRRIVRTPQLLFDPQRASWNSVIAVQKASVSIQGLLKNNLFTQAVTSFLKTALSKFSWTEKTMADYVSKINVPVLFFHGKMDKMTPLESDFKRNWEAVASPHKLAVIFDDGRHLTSCIKHKELYKFIGTMFFERSCDECVGCLQDPQKTLQYLHADLARIVIPKTEEPLS